MSDETGQRVRIARLLEDLKDKREQFADTEIPGWVIGHPSLSDTDNLVTVVARSKPGSVIPFYPPQNTEIVLTVLEGAVRIESGGTATLVGRKFFVLTAASEEYSIVPTEHPCRIFFMYFRTGVEAGEQRSMDAG